jgi:hypothetical protein
MLKIAVAVVVVCAGLAVTAPAVAAPRDSNCVDCEPAQQPDGSGSATAYTRAAQSTAPADNAPEPNSADSGVPPATPPRECADCPPPKHYDEIEVIKNTRDVDQSRTINTKSEVAVPPRVREHNKLIIHENETRNVGVIQHNHQIVEREIRYVRRRHSPRPRPVLAYRLQPVLVPVVEQKSSGCGCGGSTLSYGYRVGYVYTPEYVYPAARQPAQYAVMPAPTAYGYR